MMKFDILTLFPEVFFSVLNSSILKRASEKGILDFNYINIRDFTLDKHKRVDDYPYGGGAGMLLKTQPIYDAYKYILDNSKTRPKTIFMSPRGKVFNQEIAKELAKEEHLVLICGHYEGIDQRIIDEICDYELSIGDFVLTGGEIAAMTVCDAVSRLVPGVLSGEESYSCESHYNGMLEFPQYTRPAVFHGMEVPDVLLSGNDALINKWRTEKSYEITAKVRPELIKEEINIKEMPLPKEKFSLYYFGENEKNISLLKLQLEKNNLIPTEIFINPQQNIADKNAIVVFDNSDFVEIIADNIKYIKLNNITEFENVEYNQLKHIDNVTILEISNVIKNFLYSIEFKNYGCVPSNYGETQKLKITGKLPVEIYENNINKFGKIKYEDIFTIESSSKIECGEYTVNLFGNTILLNVVKAKSKAEGTKFIAFAKNLSDYIKTIDCNNIPVVTGDFTSLLC